MNQTQESTMVTVVRAWLRAFGISSVLSALNEAVRREQSREFDRDPSRN